VRNTLARWKATGVWDVLVKVLLEGIHAKEGKAEHTGVAIVDS
jgi:hypothetical protein